MGGLCSPLIPYARQFICWAILLLQSSQPFASALPMPPTLAPPCKGGFSQRAGLQAQTMSLSRLAQETHRNMAGTSGLVQTELMQASRTHPQMAINVKPSITI